MYLPGNDMSPCEEDMLLLEADSVHVENDMVLFGNDIAPYPMHGARGYILHFCCFVALPCDFSRKANKNTCTWEKVSFSC